MACVMRQKKNIEMWEVIVLYFFLFLISDLEQLSGESSKIQELEQENRKLNQTCSLDKR